MRAFVCARVCCLGACVYVVCERVCCVRACVLCACVMMVRIGMCDARGEQPPIDNQYLLVDLRSHLLEKCRHVLEPV